MSTTAIVRSWNQNVRQTVQELLEAGVEKVVVVTHDASEAVKKPEQTTHEQCKGMENVMVVSFSQAGVAELANFHKMWSFALNKGMMYVDTPYVLFLSPAVTLTADALHAMEAAVEAGAVVAGPKYDAGETVLGPSYHTVIRNTCGLWSAESLRKLNDPMLDQEPFSLHCDAQGHVANTESAGMEDVLAAMQLSALDSSAYGMIVDVHVPLQVGVHYDQEAKEARERVWLESGLEPLLVNFCRSNGLQAPSVAEFYKTFYR